jgi:hypothetical protein
VSVFDGGLMGIVLAGETGGEVGERMEYQRPFIPWVVRRST